MDVTNIFTVTPMNQKIELTPGETYVGSITVSNPATAAQDFAFTVGVMPYGVSGDNYDADLITESVYTQIVNWIVLKETKGTLKPNETKNIDFEINVPVGAGAGGQYAALVVSFAGKNTSNEGVAVNNRFEIASLIYATVNGDIVRKGSMEGQKITSFVAEPPIKTSAVLKNEGNVYETARVKVEVRNFFSSDLINLTASDGSNIEEIIMPETTHEVVRDITGIPSLGIYEVSQTVSYLDETSTIRQVVVVCPIWFMILIFITISTTVAFIVWIVIKSRKKKFNKKCLSF